MIFRLCGRVPVQEDEGGPGDASDGRWGEADPAQGLEGDLQQGIGALGDRVDASDHG